MNFRAPKNFFLTRSLPSIMVSLIAVLVVPNFVNAVVPDRDSETASTARVSSAPVGVEVGEKLPIRGRVDESEPTAVRIHFSARGSRAWKPVNQVATNRNGVFATRLIAKRHGQVLARPSGGRPSNPVPVRVRSQAFAKMKSRNVEIGEKAKVIGRALPGGRRPFRVVVKGSGTEIIEGTTKKSGKFTARWDVDEPGRHRVKVFVGSNRTAFGSAGPSRRVTAFRPVGASWYGPGFYGGTSACGQTLTPSTIGVAHKTLPCGTELTLRYNGNSVKAKVIDRGPFIPGREIDLTYATKERLGFGDVGDVLIDR